MDEPTTDVLSRRDIDPTELAATEVRLVLDGAGYGTGQTIAVDGDGGVNIT